MKHFKIMAVLIALLMFGTTLFADAPADAYNSGTLTKQYENQDAVCYKWVVSTGTDSIGSKHSPAINLDGLNQLDGRIYAKAASTANVNILVHQLITPGISLDATAYEGLTGVSSTAKVDTLGTLNGTVVGTFRIAAFISIEVDGQAGNPSNVDITLYIVLRKTTSSSTAPRPAWVYTTGTF